MIYTDDRNTYRLFFRQAWQKHLAKHSLSPVENEIVQLIHEHPEFINMLFEDERKEYPLNENPFFHMSLHQAIREQVKVNRPEGITTVYRQLCRVECQTHVVEHLMMSCLLEIMKEAQDKGQPMNEFRYLALLQHLLP